MYDLEEPEFSLKYGFRIIDEQAAPMESRLAIEVHTLGSVTGIDFSTMKFNVSRQAAMAIATA